MDILCSFLGGKSMFSEKFNVDPKLIDEYGAIDISLVADIPMFVDPILIFNSDNEKYKQLHENIIKFMHFLYKKSKESLSEKEIKTWFVFNEIYNNWFGFSMKGNKGLALDKEFGKLLYKNMPFVMENHGISKGLHVEKIMLIYPGSGKDKISDMTVNLIKGFLCEYTEEFAKKHIKENVKNFYVDKAEFNYETETFVSKEYFLPYIINEKGKEEFVLLTPKNILRADETAINRRDFLNNYNLVREVIDNDSLRVQVSNYIQKAIQEYHSRCNEMKKNPTEKEEENVRKKAFGEISEQHPEIYDYYIKLKEISKLEIKSITSKEVAEQIVKFISNVKILSNKINSNSNIFNNAPNAYEESKRRIEWFKDVIENQDVYKIFYDSSTGEKIIKYEEDLQRMFKLVWMQSVFKVDAETNNGRGPADFVVSYGSDDVCVIEFKLAENKKLKHVLKQVNVYKAANRASDHIIAIFYFDDKEYERVIKILKELNKTEELSKTIFLVDCRKKVSASNVK